jgi:AcrR family transcriptional regulator
MPAPTLPTTGREKRERLRSARREAILTAARKVFAEKSFEDATIADIAREAGVAAGTVYLYYASKIDLFAALNARLFEVINEAMRETRAPRDLTGSTRALIHAIFEACSRHRDLLRLVFLNPDPRTAVARRMKHADEERLRPLVNLLRGGMGTGVVREGDPRLLARMVNGLVITGLYQCFVLSDGRNAEQYEDTVVRMTIGGLRPDAPPG